MAEPVISRPTEAEAPAKNDSVLHLSLGVCPRSVRALIDPFGLNWGC
jgi:hypothetical protein